jgi:hypothetical protein
VVYLNGGDSEPDIATARGMVVVAVLTEGSSRALVQDGRPEYRIQIGLAFFGTVLIIPWPFRSERYRSARRPRMPVA